MRQVASGGLEYATVWTIACNEGDVLYPGFSKVLNNITVCVSNGFQHI